MEHNVVSIETSKKLKEAGFPQTTYAAWYHLIDTRGEVVPDELRLGEEKQNGFGPYYAAPTAQEIADQLSDFGMLRDSMGLRAFNGTPIFYGDTLAEVLAGLWLSLHKA